MLIDALSVFPEVFNSYMDASIMGRAQAQGHLRFRSFDLRRWTYDRHHSVDDEPYGGGAGMLMKVEPLAEAIRSLSSEPELPRPHVIFFTPTGTPFCQASAARLATKKRLLMVCGRYEGIDERAFSFADELISLGDYVLTGGELAALVVSDAVVRLLPGVLGDDMSSVDESFSPENAGGLLEYEQYTRPADFEGQAVPEVLLSGNHAHIRAWRRQNALERTLRWRPDLLEHAELSDEERRYIREYYLSHQPERKERE
ncbi:tRNA (guanosine(37)-N1)-methyltransferase TrmD [Collinsella sp. zg1085]|uniref:tRNA (guanosine(37)-N1)-methyltransferase TrmD n=1 Tax=Collinsella sp. zg1085 TaxID=2844380 RepID=UPI001C0C43BC|nr:tRNA (guanosine(37)-N1)-methyltransferase TrmD [Collinsella sp. zg1085]QWT17049.1 tRNA (guanosine(37)-N1)-methyltransferase TrmD [Collinsella sp. zg1085]